ncbi:MAG: hypothetical protein WC956_10110 [bacterium]
MRRLNSFYAAGAIFFLLCLTATAMAQWDQDEEPQRLQNRQWDKIDEQTKEQMHGPGLIPQDKPTKGDRVIMELSSIPTGYLYRELSIRENALRGQWGRGTVVPYPGFEKGWNYLDADKYKTALASGVVDDKIKGTMYNQFYPDMQKACSTGIVAKGKIHIRTPSALPEWMTSQDDAPPNLLYREIPFQCLAEGERK